MLFPTYIERPLLIGNDWATELLRYVYGNDDVYNAFPSGHVYLTTVISLFWMEWYPRYRWLWIAIVVSVLLSTLFTHQHYLPDLAGGLRVGKEQPPFRGMVDEKTLPIPSTGAGRENPRRFVK